MEVYLSADVQDSFLEKLKEQQTPSTIFTINGFQVRGVIKDYDEVSILIENDGVEQLVYKHAISTIAPYQKDEERKPGRPYSSRQYKDFERR